MSHPTYTGIRVTSLALLFATRLALAAKPIPSGVEVELFGSPCLLKGPFSKTVLLSVHQMSPEKVPPHLTPKEMEQVAKQAATAKSLPPALSAYRDRLVKRLRAQVAYDQSLVDLRKKPYNPELSEIFVKGLKEHMNATRFPLFRDEIRDLFSKNTKKSLTPDFLEKLKETVATYIEPDTEEEFHKAIRSSDIRYECHFGEELDDSHGDDSEDEKNAKH